jgi:hypothetical protein
MSYYGRWKLNREASKKLAALGNTKNDSITYAVMERLSTPTQPQKGRQWPSTYATCACGQPSTYLGGDPGSFMSYLCPGCQYCIANCACLDAPQPTPLPQLSTLPRGIWWSLWNDGLSGHDGCWNVQGACYLNNVGHVVRLQNYDAVRQFVTRYAILAVTLQPQTLDAGLMAGHLQMPTTSSTCGYENETPHQALMLQQPLWQTVAAWYAVNFSRQ